ncbi:MAG: hypothetical protein IPN29_09575 [Saprospiraceae bacterium]|nr:hypothetical protein [Saprospiraceae bacterium]
MESHTRVRLPVGVFIIGTGTIVYFIYPSTGGFYRILHILVKRSQVMFCHQLFAHSCWLLTMMIFPNLPASF